MKMIALLRGINVGGNKRVPMKELCALAEEVGLTEVKHYINSGNLVFEAGKLKSEKAEVLLEKAIEKQFGFSVDVVVRTANQWKKYSKGSPFSTAEKKRPNLLMLGLSKEKYAKNVVSLISEKATQEEKIKLVGDALWVDFVNGSGKSKITPDVLNRAAGSPVTFRNWNTVQVIEKMLTQT